MPKERLPEWVTNRKGDRASIRGIKKMLRSHRLHTVCESARCPNLGECFSRKRATFLILGNDCTRDCRFCAVGHSRPKPIDPGEPQRLVRAARELGLQHVVITSVTRDDLPDGGAGQFAETVRCFRRVMPGVTVEVLTPDFQGDRSAIALVATAGPDIYNHNLETVPRLYPRVRRAARYRVSLDVLRQVKRCDSDLLTKSGIMVGLGETAEEVVSVMGDLRDAGCDLLTVGQYLRPRKENLPVVEYVAEETFQHYERIGHELGFRQVMAAPLVRSSFHADTMASAAELQAEPAKLMRTES